MIDFKKVAFYTLGCKLNFSETSTIGRLFENAGYAKVDFTESPDVFVINTCSVTDNADKKCRNIVRRAKRINANSFIVVIGCYAQLKPQEIANIEGVNLVLGANEKFNIIDHLDQSSKEEHGAIRTGEIKYVKEFVPGYSMGDRTRTFLKVQDGCDYFCSFCTIPLARGRSRSASIPETLKVAQEIENSPAEEVVLTGVNIGDFGKGHESNFFDLIQELDKLEGISRFRISSIEPNLLSDEIIQFCATSRAFVPHFHIPLQSGSDEVLRQMRRRYDTALYSNRVARIKELMPNACIGVDVIVGFPGETEEDFNTTYAYLADLGVSYLHVFTYSERANTTAVRKEDVVPMPLRTERSKKLQLLSEKLKRNFYEEQVGKSGTVLFEDHEQDGFMYGFTENYVKIRAPYDAAKTNQFFDVSYDKIDPGCYMRSEELIPA